MISNIRIATFGRFVSISLLVALALVAVAAVVSVRNANEAEQAWREYEQVTARKMVLLSQVRAQIGYDGVIHHFNAYVLGGDRLHLVHAHQRYIEVAVALTAYRAVGLEERETQAFTVLVAALERYRRAMPEVERMIDAGQAPTVIEGQLRDIDDGAIEALQTLERGLFDRHLRHRARVTAAVDRIKTFAVLSGAVLFTILLLLTALTIRYTHWRLIDPLQKMVAFFERVNPRAPGPERLDEHIAKGRSELNTLARAGNRYIDSVEEHALQRARVELTLHDREQHLQAIINNAVDAIVIIDQDGLITSFNAAASTVFNYGADEVLGQNVKMLMPEPYRSQHDGYLKRYLDGGAPRVIDHAREVEGQRKDGTAFPMRLGVTEVETSGRKSFTAIIRDLSEERDTEMRLRVARDAADRANRAKSEFLASMSHELRTPLNAIHGFSQLMEYSRTDPPTPAQKEYLELIVASSEHLLGLIEQVLNLSKIDAGHLDVARTKVKVCALIDAAMKVEALRAQQNNISVTLHCAVPDTFAVYSDAAVLRQILVNFISNAIKYNRKNGVVTVSCAETEDGKVRIVVQDTGLGIATEKQKDLFVPFDRLGREAGTIEGTGIGLSITQRLAKALGCELGFESEEGQGSTFWINVPIHRGEAGEDSV